MRDFSDLTPSATVLRWTRLVKITRLDGTILRIAEAETSVTVGGNTYSPLPGAQISGVKHALDGEPGSFEIAFAHSFGGTIDTADLAAGFWDGAAVVAYEVDRGNLSGTGDPLFTGTIQPVTLDILGNGSFDCRSQSAMAEAVIQSVQPMCRTDLFSVLCGLTAASFAKTCTIASVDDRFNVTVSGMSGPPVDGWFNGGVGLSNTGFKFEVANWVNATARVTLFLPVCIDRLEVGDTLTLYPGCDKTIATCASKFTNTINFQGEPHWLGAAVANAG